MNRTRICACVGVLPFLLVGILFAQRRFVGQPRQELLEQLRSPSAEQRGYARLQLKAERRETIDFLLAAARVDVDEPPLCYQKMYAIKLLGEYRASEAASVLVDQIEYAPPFVVIDEDYPLIRFPAAEAIANIGEPALREMLTRGLANEISDSRLKLYAYVVWHHYAPQQEQELGLYRMQRLLERRQARRQADNERRRLTRGPRRGERNLARLIEIYQRINPTDPKDWPRPGRGNDAPEI